MTGICGYWTVINSIDVGVDSLVKRLASMWALRTIWHGRVTGREPSSAERAGYSQGAREKRMDPQAV